MLAHDSKFLTHHAHFNVLGGLKSLVCGAAFLVVLAGLGLAAIVARITAMSVGKEA